jgi:tetratricopeptide (TPR) repeat protein
LADFYTNFNPDPNPMKKICRALTAILFVFLAVSPLFAEGDWIKIETANFTLTGNASEKSIRKVAFKLEQFRKILSVVLPRTKFNSSIPTQVYVFENDKAFTPYKTFGGDEKKDTDLIAGYFVPTLDSNYIALADDIYRDNPYRFIFHEYFHFVMQNNLEGVPIWLNEGLAEYYSSIDIDDDGLKFILGAPLDSRILTLKEGDLIPFEKLFAVNSKSPEYNERHRVGKFYAESWALIHYLLHGENGKYQAQFSTFVNLLVNEDVKSDEAFQKAFQSDYKQFEKQLREYARRLAFPVTQYTLKEKVVWDTASKVTRLSEAEELRSIGDLLYALRRWDESEKKLLEAVKLDPNLASAYLSLGKLKRAQKDLSQAQRYFEKSIALDPNVYLSHYYLGRVLQDQNRAQDIETAVREYEKTVLLRPDSARFHAALAFLYSHIGKDKEAIAEYNQASKLEPKASSNYFHLSYILFRNNSYLAVVRALNYINTAGWDDDEAVYPALIAYFGYKRQNVVDKADAILREALIKIDKKLWGYSILRYLNKEIDQKELLLLAATTGQKTEAYTYIGMKLILDGDKDEGLKCLQWVKDNGDRDYIEYSLAVKELERIEAAKTASSVIIS